MNNAHEFESNLRPETLPPVCDLQRGIVALCRQWKNALYMPLFIQQNLRLRKGDRHPLRVLLEERSKQISVETDSVDEEIEENDETSKLLNTQNLEIPIDFENISPINSGSNTGPKKRTSKESISQSNDESDVSEPTKRKKSGIQSYFSPICQRFDSYSAANHSSIRDNRHRC